MHHLKEAGLGSFSLAPHGLGLQERISSFLFLLSLVHLLIVALAGELMEPRFLSSLGLGPAWAPSARHDFAPLPVSVGLGGFPVGQSTGPIWCTQALCWVPMT